RWIVDLYDASLDEDAAALSFSDIAINMQQFAAGEVSMDLEYAIRDIQLTTNCRSMECHRSQILSHSSDTKFLSGQLKQTFDGGMDLAVNLDKLSLFAAKYPLEYFLLYLDRLRSGPQEYMAAALPQPTESENELKEAVHPGHQNKLDLRTVGPCSMLKGAKMNISVRLIDLSVYLIPEMVDHTGALLEFTITTVLNVVSSHEKEKIGLKVSDVSLLPKLYQPSDTNGFPTIFSPQTLSTTSLLAPVTIENEYGLTMVSPTTFDQVLTVNVSNIDMSFSQLNFAIFCSALSSLGSIQTTTPEQLRKRQAAQDAAQEAEMALQVHQRLDLALKTFEAIDTDGTKSIEKDELKTLLQHAIVDSKLLETELDKLTMSVFQTIDKDKSGSIDFEEFRHYLLETMNVDHLHGYVDLFACEYDSREVIENLFGVYKPLGKTDTMDWKSFFLTREASDLTGSFWELYIEQMGAEKSSRKNQPPALLQRKLIRFLKHYEAAKGCWESIIRGNLKDDTEDLSWVIEEKTRCGGIVEFESAAKMILSQSTSIVVPEVVEIKPPPLSSVAKLRLKSDIKLGKMHVVLQDNTLPLNTNRADFVVDAIKVNFKLESEIGQHVYDINATSSEWMATLGVQVAASCYSDLSYQMEPVIEPWKLFQVNITSSVLDVMKIIPEIMSGQLVIEDTPKVVYRIDEPPVHITNMTGVTLGFASNGKDIILEPRTVQAIDGIDINNCFIWIENWGSSGQISFPTFGPKEFTLVEGRANDFMKNRVANISDGNNVTIKAQCRFEDPHDSSLILKSNVVITNTCANKMDVKFLNLVGGIQEEVETRLSTVPLPVCEPVVMPIINLLGNAEMFLGDDEKNVWFDRILLTTDIFRENQTPPSGEPTLTKSDSIVMKKGTIVPSQQKHKSTKVVKQLASNVTLKRHIMTDNTVQWEIVVLPQLVIQNALPYTVEYRYFEYTTKSTIPEILQFMVNDPSQSSNLVNSGATGEVSGISWKNPVYMSFCLVNGDAKSAWSEPKIIISSSTANSFQLARQKLSLESSLAVDWERFSTPTQPRVIKFSVPYWLVNKTGLVMSYRTPEEDKKLVNDVVFHKDFTTPVMCYAPKNRLSCRATEAQTEIPPSWATLRNLPLEETKSSNPDIFHQLKSDAAYSDPINTSAVQTNGELYSSGHVIGVDIKGLQGIFADTVSISLTPRYIVQNHTPYEIQFMAFATTQTDHLNELSGLSNCPVYFLKSHCNGVLYAFEPLSKDPVAKCQKYLSVATLGSESWSSILSVNSVGDIYFPLQDTNRERGFIVKASIQLIDTQLFVVLTDASSFPPYCVENYTMQTVFLHQMTNLAEQKSTVGYGERLAFAWDEAYVSEHKLEVIIQYGDSEESDKFAVDIDSVGPVKSNEFFKIVESKPKYLLEVVPVGSSRVLRITDAKKQHLQKHRKEESAAEDASSNMSASLYTTALDLRIAGLGLSFVDAFPQEVLYISLDDLRVVSMPKSHEWIVSIFNLQVDNMLPNTRFPVILAPVASGFNGQNGIPFFSLVIESIGDKSTLLKVMDVTVQPTWIRVEIDYVFKLLTLLEPLLASETALQSQLSLVHDLHNDAITVPQPDGNSKILYFEEFKVQETLFKLECEIQKEDIARSKSMANSRSWLVNALMQLIGIVGSKLSGSPSFYFSSITLHHCFTTQDRLISQIMQKYQRDVVLQAYKLVGSIDMIGNPVGLVEDLGSGIKAFFKVTSDEVMGDSQTRGEGVKILGKTVAKGGTGVLAKMTGSLDKFMDEVSDVTDTSHEDAKQSKDSVGMAFAKNLGKGITDIYNKPIEGAKSGGVQGFVQGAVQGIAGAPVALLKTVTSTAHTLAVEANETFDDVLPFQGRRRKELQFDDKALVPPEQQKISMVHLEIISASGLVASSGQCNPVCYFLYNNKILFQTKTLFGTANPEWRAMKNIELPSTMNGGEIVTFKVRDSFTGFESTIGRFNMPIQALIDDFKQEDETSPLSQWVKNENPPSDFNNMSVEKPRIEKEYFLWSEPKKSREGQPPTVQVLVTVLDVTGYVPPKNMFGATQNLSPYFSVELGSKVQKTTSLKSASDPMTWNETLTLDWKNLDKDKKLKFTMYDKSVLVDETLGTSEFLLDTELRTQESSLDLRANGVTKAKLRVRTEILGLPDDDSEQSPTDVETPSWAMTKRTSRGHIYDLVMSDEFNDDTRNFTAGEDHLWTALNLPDGVNKAIGYYSPKNAYTRDGAFKIQVDEGVVPIQYWDQYSAKPGWVNKEMYYTGAMVQSWNKFCLQGGFIEVRAMLPGVMSASSGNPQHPAWQRLLPTERGFYPTWPGIWLMGNLGRALFSGSTRRMWPWTYNECDPRYKDQQRISACNSTPGYGLNPNQGRGSPEIDILEGGGNEISSSIQIGPGMPFDYRLINAEDGGCFYDKQCKTLGANMANVPSASFKKKHWYQGLRYAANNKCSRNDTYGQQYNLVYASVTGKKITTNTCFTTPGDLNLIPASCDVNGDLGLMDEGKTHWGVNVNATCFAQANGYKGVYLCDPDNQYYRCEFARPEGQKKTNQMDPFNYQMDALSANWWTTQEAYKQYMNYSLEWVLGPNGHIRWNLDDQVLFEIPSQSIINVPQGGNETNPIKLPVEEPMYLIFNVATAPAWGTMPPNAGYGPCRGNQSDPGWQWKNKTHHDQVIADNKICDSFPLYLSIDYIRIWQDLRGQEENASSIGCDPPSHPTWGWILGHIEEYSDANNSVIDVAGGASCRTDDDCTRAGMSTGICNNKRCQCSTLWGGPRCTWVVDIEPNWLLRAASPRKGFGPTIAITATLFAVLLIALVFVQYRRSKGQTLLFGKVARAPSQRTSRASAYEGSDVMSAEERARNNRSLLNQSSLDQSFMDSTRSGTRYELETTPQEGANHVHFKESSSEKSFAIDEFGRKTKPSSFI
ncbi:hypothetical protein THRCLA_00403, partial [Thraustotheca clavata]